MAMNEPTDPQMTDEGKEPGQTPMGAAGEAGEGQDTQGTNAQQDTGGQDMANPLKP
jgi:hypothetical protein